MNNQAPWQREELRIYVRDIAFLTLIIVFSIFIAEGFLLKEGATIVDRVFTYLLIFIPLGTVNLIAHYYYRNRRIRITGNLRSSLRYRLSLAFMVVSIIPSIPIFFLSSNMVERLVDIFFGLDVNAAFDSADRTLDYYRRLETEKFSADLRRSRPDLFLSPHSSQTLVTGLFSTQVLNKGADYAALSSGGHITYESKPMLGGRSLPVFEAGVDARATLSEYRFAGHDFGLVRIDLSTKGEYLILGRRIGMGLEADYKQFDEVRERLRRESGWRKRVPANLRLGLGLIYVLMICSALIVAVVIARQISMPIVSLAAATRAVAEGRLDTRLEIKASGEIGILIESFNQMTQELQNLRANLLHSQRVAAWQEVAKRLVHEIKNPLTPIQLSADRMLRWLDRPEKGSIEKIVRSGSATIVEQVNVLKHMVEEFADFARMPAARPVPGSLDTIVSEAVNLFRGIPGISIEMRLAGNLPMIPVDKNILIGMVNNLVKNAVEAIESVPLEGRRRPSKIIVSTSLHRAGPRKYVILKIEDSGPGIDDSIGEKVFEPYYSTKGEHGSGLGLALVERAVLEHDARILIGRSELLAGAEFRILFRVRENENLYR